MYDATGVRLHAGRQAEVRSYIASSILCYLHIVYIALAINKRNLLHIVRYLWIISTSVILSLALYTLFLLVCIMAFGASFCYGTLLILFCMLLISVTKSNCV